MYHWDWDCPEFVQFIVVSLPQIANILAGSSVGTLSLSSCGRQGSDAKLGPLCRSLPGYIRHGH